MSSMQFGTAISRNVEATYTAADIAEQRRSVLRRLDLRPGEAVLDVGPGPGFLACEMAEMVLPGGSVTGIDTSPSMLSIARGRQMPAGLERPEFCDGQATALPFPMRPLTPSRSSRSAVRPAGRRRLRREPDRGNPC